MDRVVNSLDPHGGILKAAKKRQEVTRAKPGEKVGAHQGAKVRELVPARIRDATRPRAVRAKIAGANPKYDEGVSARAGFFFWLQGQWFSGQESAGVGKNAGRMLKHCWPLGESLGWPTPPPFILEGDRRALTVPLRTELKQKADQEPSP